MRLSVLLPFGCVFEVLFEYVAPETFLAALGSVEFKLIALRPIEIAELVDFGIDAFKFPLKILMLCGLHQLSILNFN